VYTCFEEIEENCLKITVKRILAMKTSDVIKFTFVISYSKFLKGKFRFRKFRMKLLSKRTHIFTANEIKKVEDNQSVSKEIVRAVNYVFGSRVLGDVVEFGTMTGLTATAFATAVNMYNLKYGEGETNARKIWFFDSFEGLPESRSKIDIKSPHVKTGLWIKGKCLGFSEGEFEKLIAQYIPKSDFKVIKGWFAETVNLLEKHKFSLIHIDSDLYESCFVVLDYMFKNRNISPGAVLLFDDYFCNYGAPSFGEQRAFNELVSKYQVSFSETGRYGSFQNSFIIHDYS
jgi:O-methyltransferase